MTETAAIATQKEVPAEAPAQHSAFVPMQEAPRRVMSDELYSAVVNGDILLVKTLIAQNSSALDSRDAAGNTVLLLAAKENRAEIASWALMMKADPDARNDAGMTAMMFAATNGNAALATELLDKAEASILLANALDETADDIARSRGNFALAARIVQRQQQYKQKLAADKKAAQNCPAHHCAAEDALVTTAVVASAFLGAQEKTLGSSGLELAAAAGLSRTSRFMRKIAGVLGLSKFLRPLAPQAAAPSPAQAVPDAQKPVQKPAVHAPAGPHL